MKNKILVINNIQNLSPSQIDVMSQESTSYKLQINQFYKTVRTDYIYLDNDASVEMLNNCKDKFFKDITFLIPFNKIINKEVLNSVIKNYRCEEIKFDINCSFPNLIDALIFLTAVHNNIPIHINSEFDEEISQYIVYNNKNLYFGCKSLSLRIELIEKSRLLYKNKQKRILILGNDKYINCLDFEKVEDSSLITAGVNRIWKKMQPEFLYFIDYAIIEELYFAQPELPNTKILHCQEYTDGLMVNDDAKTKNTYTKSKEFLNETYNVTNVRREKHTVNTVIWLISYLNEVLFSKDNCIFYIYGVSLTWDNDCHHFWEGDKSVTRNTADQTWYDPRFKQHLNGFQKLRKNGLEIVSCTPNSKLNDIFPYCDINLVLEEFIDNEGKKGKEENMEMLKLATNKDIKNDPDLSI